MLSDIQSTARVLSEPGKSEPGHGTERLIVAVIALTLMLSGRAMTLLYITRAGGSSPGDPPAAWLMPLVGDAVIGVGALYVAYLVWRRAGVFAWTMVLVWNAVAIWDALSAFLIHQTVPWPSFFMLKALGPSMFFAASAMHGLCIYLMCRRDVRQRFWAGATPTGDSRIAYP